MNRWGQASLLRLQNTRNGQTTSRTFLRTRQHRHRGKSFFLIQCQTRYLYTPWIQELLRQLPSTLQINRYLPVLQIFICKSYSRERSATNLGNEQDTGIAVGMKDINEPMHICSWNSTDMVYLYGELYTAQEIRDDQDLLDLLPEGFNIDPYDELNTGSAFSSDGSPVYYHTQNTPLPSARYSRIILLTDQPSFYMYVSYQSDDPPKDSWVEDILSGVSNQEDSSGDFNNTQVFTFRGKTAHYYYGLRIYYPDAIGYDSAAWPPLAPGTEDPVTTDIYP